MFIFKLPPAAPAPPNLFVPPLCCCPAAASPEVWAEHRTPRSLPNPSFGLPYKSLTDSLINDQGTAEPEAGSASPRSLPSISPQGGDLVSMHSHSPLLSTALIRLVN